MTKAIILSTFGTANKDGIDSIKDFCNYIRESFNNKFIVDYAFSSNILMNIANKKYNEGIRSLEEMLFNLASNGIEEVYIQPLHFMQGGDQESLSKIVEEYRYSFKIIALGIPLLNKTKEKESAETLIDYLEEYLDKSSNLLFIGHGSKKGNDHYYMYVEEVLKNRGFNALVGTLEGEIGKDEILMKLKNKQCNKINIYPLLIIPGNHIKKDLMGENSWTQFLESNDIKVEIIDKALLQYENIKKYYIQKINDLVSK